MEQIAEIKTTRAGTLITRIVLQGFKSFNKRISIPLLPGFNIVCGPNGVGKCLKGDSQITLADGSLHKIKDLVESSIENSSMIERIDDGIVCHENLHNYEIIAMNPMTLKLTKQPIDAFVRRLSPDFLFKIKTRSGKEIITTEYHPFFVIEKGIVEPLDADKLKVGQQIATPRILPIESGENAENIFEILKDEILYVPYSEKIEGIIDSLKLRFQTYKEAAKELNISYDVLRGIKSKQSVKLAYLLKILKLTDISPKEIITTVKSKSSRIPLKINFELNEEFARFLGYLAAEGSSSISSDQVRFVNEEKSILDDFTSVVQNLWSLEVGSGNYKVNAVDLMIYSKPMQIVLDKVFGLKIGSSAQSKIVPPQIFAANETIVRNFLAALIDGDGYITAVIDEKGKHKTYIEYSTKSKELAEGVITLLLRLGIVASIDDKLKSASNSKEKKKEKYYSVIISGIENLRKIKALLPFHSEVKKKVLEEISNWEIIPNPNTDVIPNINYLIQRLVKTLRINVKKNRKNYPRLQAYYENRCRASRDGLRQIIKFVIENFELNHEAKEILQTLTTFANSEVFWDEIVKIEKIKSEEKWVYDLSVQGYHNFVANNFIIHNSNVLDAIAFVLGRTSAKSLRADKLHELIFSGNQNAAQYASVTLYLDNSTKLFPFEESEISITRKVNRRGVSIYKMNGHTTTREKIVDMLAAVRIYSDGHNIVLQGDITEVIEMMPEERRAIVDEISGIADYNDKKDKATKDLEAVDAKLKEAEIVITERYDLYKKLENERNAAIKYNQLQKQMQLLKASLAYRKFTNFDENQKAMDDEITKKEVESEVLQKEIEQIERELEERERGIQQLASKLTNIAKRVEVEKEISYLRTKILIDKDKMESNKKEIERLDNLIQRMSTLESRMQEMGEMPRAVKAILDLKMNGVHGTIRNLIKVPEKYQIAAEVTAAGRLNDIVVDNDVIANQAIEFLKREKIGRATFLPLNKIKARDFDARNLLKEKGVVDVVTKVLKFEQKFASAIDFVFGSTLLVDNLSTARTIGIGKARMVTLDGDLVERSGAMIGGFYAHQPKFAKEVQEDEISEYHNLKKKLEEEIKTLQEEIKIFDEKLKTYSQSEETREFVDLSKMKIDTEEELEKMRSKRRTAYEKRLQVQTDLNRLKIQKAKVEAELENVKIEVEQYGQIEYLNQGIKTLEIGIQNAMKELAALGAVNFKAIEQYENFKTEFDEYKKKYEKILEEKKAVLDMISQIEEKRKTVFYEAMVELSKKFDEIFFKMTGGHASVNLEDPENLESGLMIQATPAGKNLLNIDSMSGGEKSITALAFLFAVQEYRPAPFYILDEIDAALDKENTSKVANLIKNLSKDAQFIVISHNDNTIKMGDRVYGCTMERGETKIIGLELPKE